MYIFPTLDTFSLWIQTYGLLLSIYGAIVPSPVRNFDSKGTNALLLLYSIVPHIFQQAYFNSKHT